MNVANMQHMESGFAFQPIEDDSSSSSSSSSSAMEYEKVASTTEIFRDITMEDPALMSFNTTEDDKPYTVCRAKPIDSSESTSNDKTERRVISPFTHSKSWEELQREDRDEEKLTPLDWSSSSSETIGEHPCIVDFSLLFEPNTFASNIDFMDDCNDDFSLSSCEANSMCKNLDDIESISDDPSSFWESGASVEIYLDRSSSDISLDHSD